MLKKYNIALLIKDNAIYFKVTLSCDLIPLYTPVSSFGSFSHEIGLFLGCTKNGFKVSQVNFFLYHIFFSS